MLCHSFVFIAPSSPVLYTLSLHDALPISVVEALTQIASPSAMRLLERAIDDGDRDVRIAAVRFLGSRGYRNAATRIESMVTGSKLSHHDLTEKMGFLEAFGALVGPKGLAAPE